jgi:hypothetical protein
MNYKITWMADLQLHSVIVTEGNLLMAIDRFLVDHPDLEVTHVVSIALC